jgi:AcrR family transcriptional regulator
MDTLRKKTAAIRRRHVLDAALRVFGERGFRGATIRDVAREAGVSDGTIYNIFENKAALLDGLLSALADETAPGGQAEADVEHHPSLEALLVKRWASLTPQTLALLRVVLAEALVDPDLRAQLLDRVITPPILALEPMLETDAALHARIATASFLGLVMMRLLGEPELENRQSEIPKLLAALLAKGPLAKDIGSTTAKDPP